MANPTAKKFNELYLGPKNRRLIIQKTMDKVFGRNIEKEKPPMQIRALISERPHRRFEQKSDQDWTSVWPAAQSYRHTVVPLPLRMGYTRDWRKKMPPKSYGNLELLKVPNFLHLTPKHIQAHCEAIKKFCTKFPAELKQKEGQAPTPGIQPLLYYFPIEMVYSDWVHQGTNIREERARAVKMRVKFNQLELDTHAHNKFIQLVQERYNPDDDFVTIQTDRCPTRKQNRDFCLYVLTALYHESRKTAPWETTYVEELLALKEAERRENEHSDLETKRSGQELEEAEEEEEDEERDEDEAEDEKEENERGRS